MQIPVTQAPSPHPKPADDQLGFGTIFTDHMLNLDYSPDRGWHNPRIEPYGPFQLDPSTMVFHYGQAVFEGLKAYRTPSGAIQLFRPRDLERDWVPSAPETSLYIRPTVISTDPFLGVRASHTYRYFVILSPVGAYYAEGFNPVKIWVTRDHVRAVRGGLGEAKTPGNYAASLYAGEEANRKGYAQVLWLDGVEQNYVEEVGSMNIFFVIDDELVTPSLNGSILPGITRDSVLSLGRSWGMTVTERRISIDEVMAAHDDGRLKEIFGSGTAAVISPVGELAYGDRVINVGDGKVGPLARKFFEAIKDIQYGHADDSFGWIEPV